MSDNGNGNGNGKTEFERRQAALAELRKLSSAEIFQVAVRAGIYTEDGELTAPYRSDTSTESATRPTD